MALLIPQTNKKKKKNRMEQLPGQEVPRVQMEQLPGQEVPRALATHQWYRPMPEAPSALGRRVSYGTGFGAPTQHSGIFNRMGTIRTSFGTFNLGTGGRVNPVKEENRRKLQRRKTLQKVSLRKKLLT